MKISRGWLRDWIDVPWSSAELGARLTMAGFELEALGLAAPAFEGVVVGEILSAERHPESQKLQVCRVTIGAPAAAPGGIDDPDSDPGSASVAPLQIVCGASNARVGLRTAVARVGARLPDVPEIGIAKLRGVESEGMLCSAKELGLAESSDGILELPADAPLGASLRDFLGLDDEVLELNVTPNRGDAMSVLGIAREVAALARQPLTGPSMPPVAASVADVREVRLEWPEACPQFLARMVRGVDNRRTTPLWLRERLRRSGVRSISPVVDVTNYVLLELGQPLHAYDAATLRGAIRARHAKPAEALTLLDGKAIALDADELVIADDAGAVGLAGIMGGARTAVTAATVDVLLEAAWFAPAAIAGRARRHGLQTDASQRFERGVDPGGTARALERATALLLEIAGGAAGPVQAVRAQGLAREPLALHLRRARVERLLGLVIPDAEIEARLRSLGLGVTAGGDGWTLTAPSWRFDLSLEADLIEEVARLGEGYDAIPERDAVASQQIHPRPETRAAERSVLAAVAARGYREAISFAFVDPALQSRLFPEAAALALANPISSDLAVMRVSLWPGLLRAALENQRRQQDRIRLFEHAVRFRTRDGTTHEEDSLAGVALGPRLPEQWGAGREPVDFFDVKADVESLLTATGQLDSFSFQAATLECLHPGRSARIEFHDRAVGWIGELHPQLVSDLGFLEAPVLFEVDYSALATLTQSPYEAVSRYPSVRRDLALIVDEDVSLSTLRDRVTFVTSGLLRELRVFDVYRGRGIEKGRKSVALGLIFQDKARTLTDPETDRVVARVVAELTASCNARLRE